VFWLQSFDHKTKHLIISFHFIRRYIDRYLYVLYASSVLYHTFINISSINITSYHIFIIFGHINISNYTKLQSVFPPQAWTPIYESKQTYSTKTHMQTSFFKGMFLYFVWTIPFQIIQFFWPLFHIHDSWKSTQESKKLYPTVMKS